MNNKVYWRTKNGNLIDVDDMDDNHVRNAFKMLLRSIQRIEKAPKPKPQHFVLHGDMAQVFHDSYLSDEDDDRFDEDQY